MSHMNLNCLEKRPLGSTNSMFTKTVSLISTRRISHLNLNSLEKRPLGSLHVLCLLKQLVWYLQGVCLTWIWTVQGKRPLGSTSSMFTKTVSLIPTRRISHLNLNCPGESPVGSTSSIQDPGNSKIQNDGNSKFLIFFYSKSGIISIGR